MSENENIIHKIRRDGRRELAFVGRIIGESSSRGDNRTRWTTYTIYRTVSKKIVLSLEYETQWQGENDHIGADSFATAKEAIAFLIDRDGGELSEAAQLAIEEATENDEEFAAAFVENV